MNELPPFQHLLDAHGSEVHRFLVASAGVRAAEDLWQETFLAALRAYPDLERGSNLRAWLFTIARSKLIDGWRRQARGPEPMAEVPDSATQDRRDPGTGVWLHVRDLPAGQRDALALRYGADLAYRDMATLLACSEDAARKRVSAGLAALRQRLDVQETR